MACVPAELLSVHKLCGARPFQPGCTGLCRQWLREFFRRSFRQAICDDRGEQKHTVVPQASCATQSPACFLTSPHDIQSVYTCCIRYRVRPRQGLRKKNLTSIESAVLWESVCRLLFEIYNMRQWVLGELFPFCVVDGRRLTSCCLARCFLCCRSNSTNYPGLQPGCVRPKGTPTCVR